MFKAGFSSRIISPQQPMRLGGYAARNKLSCGIHDNICTKSFFISDGKSDAVLVSCDVLCLKQEQVDQIRKKAFEKYGIKNIIIGATHTHSAPDTLVQDGTDTTYPNRKWLIYVEDMAVEAIGEAIRSAEPVKLYAGSKPAPGVAKNRRTGETAVDDTLMVIRAEDLYGRTKGIIFNYACHCTILDANNYMITADYPGYIYKKLNERFDQATVMFFNGACGNINIGYSADASALGVDMGDVRTYCNAEKKADILLEKIYEILASATELKSTLTYRTLPLEFPLKDNLLSSDILEKSIAECGRKIAECFGKDEKEKLEIEKIYYESLLQNVKGYNTEGVRSIRGESVIIGVGDVLLITVPLELFCEIGIAIKEVFADKWRAAILGYTNGYYGYFPTRDAYLAGGYECETSVLSIDSETYLINTMKAAKANLDLSPC